jgi:sulfatase modifying factor 1
MVNQRLIMLGKALVGLAMAAVFSQACHAVAQTGDHIALPGFAIDRTEVTIAQFARYAAVSGIETRAEREGGGFEFVGGWQRRAGWTWRTPDGGTSASDQLPAVHLTHGEAQAYCQWSGGRLPSAAEWQSAAYTEQRSVAPAPWKTGKTYEFPTGDRPQGANTSGADAWPRAAPAGATPPGVNGLLDMGANVWEWVSDERGKQRRTMGGSWWYGGTQMRADVDAWKDADFPAVYIGFRCVYANR